MSTEHHNERPIIRLDDRSVWWTKPYDTGSGSCLPDTSADIMTEQGQRQDESTENGTIDLVQFLKKTPPPPTNYMSVPDDASSNSSSEEDKWDKLKVKLFRHHHGHQPRSRRRRPPLIRLPDSAVAATTTEGHRYIAISIPKEYSHLSPLPNSQYPVYDSIDANLRREINSRFGPWRNLPPNRLVTALNPVTEDKEPSQTSNRPSSQRPRSAHVRVLDIQRRRPRPRLSSLPSAEEQRYTPRRSSKRTIAGGVPKVSQTGQRSIVAPPVPPVPPKEERTVAIGPDHSGTNVKDFTGQQGEAPRRGGQGSRLSGVQESTLRQHEAIPGSQHSEIRPLSLSEIASQSSNRTSSHRGSMSKPIITITVPSRTSSKRTAADLSLAERIEQAVAESSNGSSPSGNDNSSNGNSSSSNSNRAPDRPRGSVAESILASTYSPQLMKAQAAIVVRPAGHPNVGKADEVPVESPLDLNATEFVPENRLLDAQIAPLKGEKSAYLMPTSTASTAAAEPRTRRHSVSLKKRRDMEGLRAKMQEKQKQEKEEREEQTSETSTSNDGRARGPTPRLRKVASENDLALASSSPASRSSGERELARRRTEKGKGKERVAESHRYTFMPGIPPSLPKLHAREILAPPHQRQQRHHLSPTGATTPATSPLSATPSSLSVNSKSSSVERLGASASSTWHQREERRQRYIAHALAEERETLENLPRSELIRRYEALRAHRIYERERRLRKLERALASCVPVLLENLNILLREQSALLERAGLAAPLSPGDGGGGGSGGSSSSASASVAEAMHSFMKGFGRERRRGERKRYKKEEEEEREEEEGSVSPTGSISTREKGKGGKQSD
ncbi:hypothetical protein F5Y17DRAFT_474290 [Xylariaceae sp. FL0594]|nr:hypothetical protein F5Y17DRAFT_474290 [Xylariaceae sp. FL0594]